MLTAAPAQPFLETIAFQGRDTRREGLPLRVDERVADFVRAVSAAECEQQSRELFRKGLPALTSRLQMYPPTGAKPSRIFEALSSEARGVASECLPLAIALSMHWYPLCALQCARVSPVSVVRIHRALLLKRIRRQRLIVANAGSDRAEGVQQRVIAARVREGFRLRGTYDYMSLASVADVVLMKAKVEEDGRELLCLTKLRSPNVETGPWRFTGLMRLSDTTSVTFLDQLVPHGCYVVLPQSNSAQCLSNYQRSWFHLFIADIYMARAARLYAAHKISMTTEQRVERNEIAHLRGYCLYLLDKFDAREPVDRLLLATSTLKLQISRFAQSASAALHMIGLQAADTQLRADAAELCFIQRQPTADHKIIELVS